MATTLGFLAVVLLGVIAWQLAGLARSAGLLIRYLRRSLILSAGIKAHVREAKEEHWSALHAIRELLLFRADRLGLSDEERAALIERLPDPSPGGLNAKRLGRWGHHMPQDYFEVGGTASANSIQAGMRREAEARIVQDAGIDDGV